MTSPIVLQSWNIGHAFTTPTLVTPIPPTPTPPPLLRRLDTIPKKHKENILKEEEDSTEDMGSQIDTYNIWDEDLEEDTYEDTWED